jgi:hypothetical protein
VAEVVGPLIAKTTARLRFGDGMSVKKPRKK